MGVGDDGMDYVHMWIPDQVRDLRNPKTPTKPTICAMLKHDNRGGAIWHLRF